MKTLLDLLKLRQAHQSKELSQAVERREWSRVPGLDGIEIGLILAIKLTEERIAELEKHELQVRAGKRTRKARTI